MTGVNAVRTRSGDVTVTWVPPQNLDCDSCSIEYRIAVDGSQVDTTSCDISSATISKEQFNHCISVSQSIAVTPEINDAVKSDNSGTIIFEYQEDSGAYYTELILILFIFLLPPLPKMHAFLLIRKYLTNAKDDITVKRQPSPVSLIAIVIPVHVL